MTEFKISFECLELGLTRPLVMARETLVSRHIIRVTLTDSENRSGCGDIAPLQGLHRETLDQALAQLHAVSEGRSPKTLYPSVQLGLDMARWQMTHEMPSGAVKLNALVWGDPLSEVDALLGQGYECLKVKVGRDTVAADIERVQEIKQKVQGRASVRLDANRSWTLDQAVTFGRAVGFEQIDYIEEPTIRYEDHMAFFQATGMPYAWDESLLDHSVHEADGLAALVIKPACLGPLETVDQLVCWAKAHDRQAVVSRQVVRGGTTRPCFRPITDLP
jgi:O-succinylbenzoate synthase